jgi:hypothetical protein
MIENIYKTCFLLVLLTAVYFVHPAFAQDVKAAAIQARTKQPAVLLDHAQASQVLKDTVALLGADYGFLKKTGGNKCDVGAQYTVSCDWLIRRSTNQGCDLFVDAPGYGADGAPVRGTMQPAGCHLEPSPGEFVPYPGTLPPPPPPPSGDLSKLAELVAHLEERIHALDASQRQQRVDLEGLREDQTALRGEFGLFKSKPVELPLDALLKGLQQVHFPCIVSAGGGILRHGHGCTITEPSAK